MPRPRREEFILDVRRSARTLQKPNVEADSDAVDTDAIAKILLTGWIGTAKSASNLAMRQCMDAFNFIDCGPIERKGKKAKEAEELRCRFSGHARKINLYAIVSHASPHRPKPDYVVPTTADNALRKQPFYIILNQGIYPLLQALAFTRHVDVYVKRQFNMIKGMEQKTKEERKQKYRDFCDTLLTSVSTAQQLIRTIVTGPPSTGSEQVI